MFFFQNFLYFFNGITVQPGFLFDYVQGLLGKFLVVQCEDETFQGVRVGGVSKVVDKGCQFQRQFHFFCDCVAVQLQVPEGFVNQPVNAQGVLKPRMFGSGVHQVAGAKLSDVSQSLNGEALQNFFYW